MDQATSLSAADALDTTAPSVVHIAPPIAPAPPAEPFPVSKLLVASVVLNVAVAAGVGAAAMSLHSRLNSMTARSDTHGATVDRQAQTLDGLVEQSRSFQSELVSLRHAVSSHAREESLFLKMLIMKPELDQALARRIAVSVQSECLLFGQDPNLVIAIMAVESDFNPRAVSYQGAVGLMQVMPHWRKVLGLQSELTEPEVSIRAGIQILGFYQQMYRDLDMALTAYNRGPGPVDGALIRGANPANGYAAKVLAAYEKLKTLDVSSRP